MKHTPARPLFDRAYLPRAFDGTARADEVHLSPDGAYDGAAQADAVHLSAAEAYDDAAPQIGRQISRHENCRLGRDHGGVASGIRLTS